jgi:parvulin-like peptidyl-prolyl isomerase
MSLRALSPLVLLALSACASSAAEEPGPAQPEAAKPKLSEGQQCLEDAQALREPKESAPLTIHVSHILVRHKDLRRPEGATRTREQACLRALEALHALQAGKDWDEVVREYSDAKNDALGRVHREDLATDFANAAFALDINEISYVVETSRGFHIILRKE